MTDAKLTIDKLDLSAILRLQNFIDKYEHLFTLLNSLLDPKCFATSLTSVPQIEPIIHVVSSEVADRSKRKFNVIIRNIPHTVNPTPSIQQLIHSCGLNISIASTKRLNSRSKNKPVLVTFYSQTEADLVLQNPEMNRTLLTRKAFIGPDLTPMQRRELQTKATQLKTDVNHTFSSVEPQAGTSNAANYNAKRTSQFNQNDKHSVSLAKPLASLSNFYSDTHNTNRITASAVRRGGQNQTKRAPQNAKTSLEQLDDTNSGSSHVAILDSNINVTTNPPTEQLVTENVDPANNTNPITCVSIPSSSKDNPICLPVSIPMQKALLSTPLLPKSQKNVNPSNISAPISPNSHKTRITSYNNTSTPSNPNAWHRSKPTHANRSNIVTTYGNQSSYLGRQTFPTITPGIYNNRPVNPFPHMGHNLYTQPMLSNTYTQPIHFNPCTQIPPPSQHIHSYPFPHLSPYTSPYLPKVTHFPSISPSQNQNSFRNQFFHNSWALPYPTS
uniref:Uncharacterized protein n=1 Tax=Schistocephalus solidus TaxID=70667 RepID=A0A0X3NXU5_SCHSO